MKTEVGLWIDHRKAVVVTVSDGSEETTQITSNMEKHVRYPGAAQDVKGEDQVDRRYVDHLGKYYDDVITHIRDAQSILILGPGEAKGELAKRLQSKDLGERIVGIEAVDKMTDPQIAAIVRERFRV